jgi:site-specific recombinase XerC
MPGHHRGRCPRNKGRHYPADPPTTEEIIAVMRRAGAAPYGLRARALVVLLWRAGLRVSEALALAESDLDHSTGGVLVRLGKGGKRRHVGMDRWGWQQLQPWLDRRIQLPVGALLCVIDGLPPGDRGLPQRPARRFTAWQSKSACGAVSRPINFAMRTRSRSPAKASR